MQYCITAKPIKYERKGDVSAPRIAAPYAHPWKNPAIARIAANIFVLYLCPETTSIPAKTTELAIVASRNGSMSPFVLTMHPVTVAVIKVIVNILRKEQKATAMPTKIMKAK